MRYHDEQRGVPVYEDRDLFEFLMLERAPAGLSWETILRKRDHCRAAFQQFDPHVVARCGKRQIAALRNNPGIVGNRLTIESTVQSARALLARSTSATRGVSQRQVVTRGDPESRPTGQGEREKASPVAAPGCRTCRVFSPSLRFRQ